ncbi:MAG: leucine-rich repeat domain-containing protein [Alphaproteobacteria bacterium]|nr:leucine-rich repeat domain-containing protein [Alphaproteobacteria bacterium]
MQKIFEIFGLMMVPVVCLADDNVPSGTCGENCNWKIEDGTLKITGGADGSIGTMDSGELNVDGTYPVIQPWKDYKDDFNKVDIQGVQNIGHAAFKDFSNITDIYISNTVTDIGRWAFTGADIENLILPDMLVSVGYQAFSWGVGNETNLKEIVIPDCIEHLEDSAFGPNENQLSQLKIICKGNQEKCKNVMSGYKYFDSGYGYYHFSLADNVQKATAKYCDSQNFYWNGDECLREPDMTKRKCCNNCKNLSGLCHRLIYSVEEANKVAKPTGNTVRIKYR